MKNVLVLSREKNVLESISLILPKKFFILPLTDASQAINSIQTNPIDIVIADTPVAEMDPGDFLCRVRKISPESAVIALSATRGLEFFSENDTGGSATEALCEIIGKPFNRKEFLAAFRRAEEKNSLLKELKLLRDASSPDPSPEDEALQPGREPVPYAHYYYQEAIRKFSKALTYIFDPGRLLDAVVTAVAEIFDLNKTAIMLRDSSGSEFNVKAHCGLEEKPAGAIRMNASEGMPAWLRKEGRVLKRSEFETKKPGREHLLIIREMDMLGAHICFPLTTQGELIAIISVGRKITGGDITHEDVGLLATMASYAAVAIHNSLLHCKIASQENYHRAIMHSIDPGVLTINKNAKITTLNKAGMDILALDSDSLGESVQKAGSRIADIMLRALEIGETVSRHEIFTPGETGCLAASTSLLTGENGTTEGCVLVFTKLKNATSSTDDSGCTDEDALWMNFAESIAHEVRNPLVSISTFTQLFPEKYNNKKFRTEFYNLMSRDVERLNKLIDKLEKYAEPVVLKIQEEKIDRVIDEVLCAFKSQLSAGKIKVKKNYSPKDYIQHFDPDLLVEALSRIVFNSIEAMPEGGELAVSVQKQSTEDNSCLIEIRDTGEGIPAGNMKKLFSPFFSTRTRAIGLGLPIAEKILLAHSATLELSGELNEGVTARICLPDRAQKEGKS